MKRTSIIDALIVLTAFIALIVGVAYPPIGWAIGFIALVAFAFGGDA